MHRNLPVLLLVAASAASAGEPDAPADQASLEPIVVNPRPDPLDENMQRLRKSMEDPNCRDCPQEIRAYHKSVYQSAGEIIGFFTGAGMQPPQLSPAERVEWRVRNEWRQAEWGPEMDDFR